MNKTLYTLPLVALCIFANAAEARPFSGKLNVKFGMDDKDRHGVYWISDRGDFRVDLLENGKPQATFIAQSKATGEKCFTVMHAQKMYLELPPEMIKSAANMARPNIEKEDGLSDYKLTKMGKTKVAGETVIHVRGVHKKNGKINDVYFNPSVPFARMPNAFGNATATAVPDYQSAMNQIGVKGFPVKIVKDKKHVIYEVTKIQRQKLGAAVFLPPSEYQGQMMPNIASALGALPGMLPPESRKALQDAMKR